MHTVRLPKLDISEVWVETNKVIPLTLFTHLLAKGICAAVAMVSLQIKTRQKAHFKGDM
ncbi:hypothetical protein GCM10008983_11460 [Lentibacillus halophilus]|uniref:Uncharacterized protein n=1 Tax=Lentibacillus halophilus TaxID=295065 RepID=A0ABP3J0U1_9BACI